MTDREQIFSAIRQALEPLSQRTPYPQWDPQLAVSRMAPAAEAATVETFRERLTATKALLVEGWDGLVNCLRGLEVRRGYVDASLLGIAGPVLDAFDCSTEFDRTQVDSYGFGITPASGGIAETGTLILRDADSPYRLGALAPWVHVAVLARESIFPTVSAAMLELGDDPSIVLVTGPSKTADIEGILIQGVHGPGVQICCLL